MDWRVLGETLVTLLVIMDPPGNAPIFVALTRGREPAEVTRASLSCPLSPCS